jgi:hypothetical protein
MPQSFPTTVRLIQPSAPFMRFSAPQIPAGDRRGHSLWMTVSLMLDRLPFIPNERIDDHERGAILLLHANQSS